MSGWVRPALLIAAKDLRLRLRDRSALVVAFVAPLVIAAIISLALGGGRSNFRATYAVADADRGELSRAFFDGLRAAPGLREVVTLREVAGPAEARSMVASGQASAAFVIPAGFSDAVAQGRPISLTVLRSTENPIGSEVAEAIADRFAAELDAARLAVSTAVAGGAAGLPPDGARVQQLAAKARAERLSVRLVDGAVGVREVRAASYYGPSMAIFFLFFTVQFGAVGILNERRNGTLARLRAAPLASPAIVLGKALGTFALGLLSLATMILATSALLGASWGDPLAVAALSVAIVLAAMGITALAASQASTEQRAEGFASIATMGLAMLGGNFIPVDQAPEVMRTIALATPNGLALRGFTDLVADGGDITSILPYLAGILAFAAASGGIALARAREALAG